MTHPTAIEANIYTYEAGPSQVKVAGEIHRQPSVAEQTLRYVGDSQNGPQAIREETTNIHSAVGSEARDIIEVAATTGQQIEIQMSVIEAQAACVEPTKLRAEATAEYLGRLLNGLPPEAPAVAPGTVPEGYSDHEVNYSGDIAFLGSRMANITAQLTNLQQMSLSAVRDSNEQTATMTAHVGRLQGELQEVQAINLEARRQEYDLVALYNTAGGARDLGEQIDELAEQLRKMAKDYDAKFHEKETISADLRQSEEQYYILKSTVSHSYSETQSVQQQGQQALVAGIPADRRTPESIEQKLAELTIAQDNAQMAQHRFHQLYAELRQVDQVRGPKEARVGTLITEMQDTEVQAGELYVQAQRLAYALRDQARLVLPIKRNLDDLQQRLQTVQARVLPEQPAQPEEPQPTHDLPRFGQ